MSNVQVYELQLQEEVWIQSQIPIGIRELRECLSITTNAYGLAHSMDVANILLQQDHTLTHISSFDPLAMFDSFGQQEIIDTLFARAIPFQGQSPDIEELVSRFLSSLDPRDDKQNLYFYKNVRGEKIIPILHSIENNPYTSFTYWFALVRTDDHDAVVRLRYRHTASSKSKPFSDIEESTELTPYIELAKLRDLGGPRLLILFRYILFDGNLIFESRPHDRTETGMTTLLPQIRDWEIPTAIIRVADRDLLSCSIKPPDQPIRSTIPSFSQELCDKIGEILYYIAATETHSLYEICLEYEIFHLYSELAIVLVLLGFRIDAT